MLCKGGASRSRAHLDAVDEALPEPAQLGDEARLVEHDHLAAGVAAVDRGRLGREGQLDLVVARLLLGRVPDAADDGPAPGVVEEDEGVAERALQMRGGRGLGVSRASHSSQKGPRERTSISRRYMATGSKSTRSSLPYAALAALRLLALRYLLCQALRSGVTAW